MFRFTKTIIGKNNNKVIIFLNGWKGKSWHILPIANLLRFVGYYCIVYSYDKMNAWEDHAKILTKDMTT